MAGLFFVLPPNGIVKLTIFAKNGDMWRHIKDYGYRTVSRDA